MKFFNKILLLLILFYSSLYSSEPVKNGMVVSAEPLATQIGLKILRDGGNAVDAAVAVGFALAVTYPVAGNIGGGGYMVIHTKDGKNLAIDYRERAPLQSSKNMYLDSAGDFKPGLAQDGALASGVPGSVAGLLFALQKYGSMPLSKILQPAINLAEIGHPLSASNAEKLNASRKRFINYPGTAAIFTKISGTFNEGEVFVQTDLAKTLRAIAENGSAGFYDGWVSEKIVSEMRRSSGIISRDDLKDYSVIERNPVKGSYRGFDIISMPPSSSGGIALLQLLNILENYDLGKIEYGSAKYYSILAEAMKRVYADRSEYLGDPDFYNVPQPGLLSKEYARAVFNSIGSEVTPSSSIKPGNPKQYFESDQTTHYSCIDKSGNAVSVTTTINSGFGSGLVVEGCGFFLNNEMDDFSAKPGTVNQFGLTGGEANSIQPGKRMLSSMTPTILLKNNKPFLILGSPGGSTIITAVLQVILNIVDFKMSLQEAMNKPRIHHQWIPDEIQYERDGISEDTWKDLTLMGYKRGAIRVLGLVEAIQINPATGNLTGCTDPRGHGSAKGY